MKVFPCVAFLTLLLICSASGQAPRLTWHGVRSLPIEGKGWEDTKDFYDRLPARAEKMVRPSVWNLSRDSAGLCARFVTDAESISAKWTLRKESLSMPHMPASGMSGLDLYVKEQGKWRWLGAGRPKQFPTNEAVLVRNVPKAQREYLLYLPLYNGVTAVDIGVPAEAKFHAAPSRDDKKPIVFYGTSILQGGCASRPGLAYPAIIGRKLDWPVINLGFSGNAKSEPELAELLAELDPSAYVLDPLPNMDAVAVRERIEPFVHTLRSAHPKTPIILVESLSYTDGFLVETRKNRYTSSNAALREAFKNLKKSGVKNLHYIPGKDLIGQDGEGTVDGTHPNDLGFMRMADEIGPVLRRLVR
ncbi:MAG: SGNH/GDSL hydrolase family protein [Verrucomicrobia bacterium]|nr:SGNH/GDSL hydrolase family protein [Verrucomicrobiota bacterium]